MIDFAAGLNLCLTFSDATGGTYISKARGLIQPTTKGGWELDDDITWSSKEEYVKAVLKRTSAWDLAKYNSRVNQYGPVPGEVYCGHRFLDVLIHGWDVATATGQDATLPSTLVDACIEVVTPQADLLLGSGMFATDVDAGAGADHQEQLLAMLGRRA